MKRELLLALQKALATGATSVATTGETYFVPLSACEHTAMGGIAPAHEHTAMGGRAS